jgi:spore coat polysaccharide biosynthesis protein SpsF (cytidylyltransferase family)
MVGKVNEFTVFYVEADGFERQDVELCVDKSKVLRLFSSRSPSSKITSGSQLSPVGG